MRILPILLSLVFTLPAQAADDEEQLTSLLNEFLAGASVNDAAAHQRFWAEDLIYTSSNGTRFGKRAILEGLTADDTAQMDEPAVIYSAEDIQVRLLGETAVVAFRLLGTVQDDSGEVMQFLNTGTFRKREGEWRAVAWQATRISETD